MIKDLLPTFAKTAGVVFIVLIGLFLYSNFGPSLPLSVVNSNRSEFFTSQGEGKVYAKPDVAIIQIGYTTSAPTVEAAQKQANETINKISTELKALGIKDEDIQTTNYSVYPEYNANEPRPLPVAEIQLDPRELIDPGEPNEITGYNVNVNLQVKVRDLTKANQVIDVATANGANQVGGLSFTIDDPEKYQKEARKIAIADAKQNASELAAETGITLGKIINVYESNPGRGGMYDSVSMAKEAPVGSNTQVEPGQSEIVVQVTLSYETR